MNPPSANVSVAHATDDAGNTLVVHFDKEKALRQDYDFQIIVPLTVEYHNLQSESTIRIEAEPTETMRRILT